MNSKNAQVVADVKEALIGARPHIRKVSSAIHKISKISREILEVYSAIKEKDYISFALGGMSVIGVLTEHLVKGSRGFDAALTELGTKQICSSIDDFIRSILKRSNVPVRNIWNDKGDEIYEDGALEEFDLGNSKAYFAITGRSSYVDGVFVKDENQFYKDISPIIEEKIGKFLILENVLDSASWCKKLELSPVPVSDDAYINSNKFDEDDIVDSVNKFFDKGLNRSMLFFGPPGTGKSTLAVRVTNRLGGKILILDGSSVADRSTSAVFNAISVVDPTVILFDDLDRFGNLDGLLGDIERMNRIHLGRNRLFIATVNNLGAIPEAMRRPGRFDQVVEFLPPTEDVRLQVLKAYSKQFSTPFDEEDLAPLAKITEGITQAYLREIILRASVIGIDKIVEHIDQMKRIAAFESDQDQDQDQEETYICHGDDCDPPLICR